MSQREKLMRSLNPLLREIHREFVALNIIEISLVVLAPTGPSQWISDDITERTFKCIVIGVFYKCFFNLLIPALRKSYKGEADNVNSAPDNE
jgi:hypothetical protein